MMVKAATVAWWALAIAYPIWVVLSVVAWFGEPRIGVDATEATDGRMTITRIFPGGAAWVAGAQVGDVLLELDGVEIDVQTWKIRRDSGTEFRILTTPDDRIITDSVDSGVQFTGTVVVSLMTISFFFVASSFFIFFRSNRSTEILTVSVLFLTSAAAFGLVPAAARGHAWPMYLEVVSVRWSSALFFIFFSILQRPPDDRWSVSRLLRWGMVAWALTLDLLYSLSVTSQPGIYEGVRQLVFAQFGAGLIGGVAYLVRSYLGNDSPVMKEQIRIMVFGTTAAVLPFVLLSIAPVVIGQSPVVRPELTILAVILVPLSFAYAIMRHRLMGIRRLVHRGAAYALISIVVFAIYGALIATLRLVAGTEISGDLGVQTLLLVILFMAVPFISGMRRLAFASVDRLLYREFVDHAELARRVSVGASYAVHLSDLTRTVLGTIAQELRLSFAAFVGVSDGRSAVKASVGDIPEDFADRLNSDGSGVPEDRVSFSEMALHNHNGRAILVRLARDGRDAWILCLGPKMNEEPFQREDKELAQSVASHIATIVEKLELLEELQTKTVELRELNRRLVGTQETERARIASYLHDEPLQQITNLIWRHSGSGLPTSAQEELQRIASGLRSFTSRLHPALLEDLGLVRALEWLGSQASADSDFSFVFDAGAIGQGARLDPDVELALYRIAQEALTNCQRHARPSTVWLHLTQDSDQITLSVEDDGVGFPTTREPDTRLGLIGMRERAEQLGGYLRIGPRSPSGARVMASFPLDNGGGIVKDPGSRGRQR